MHKPLFLQKSEIFSYIIFDIDTTHYSCRFKKILTLTIITVQPLICKEILGMALPRIS